MKNKKSSAKSIMDMESKLPLVFSFAKTKKLSESNKKRLLKQLNRFDVYISTHACLSGGRIAVLSELMDKKTNTEIFTLVNIPFEGSISNRLIVMNNKIIASQTWGGDISYLSQEELDVCEIEDKLMHHDMYVYKMLLQQQNTKTK